MTDILYPVDFQGFGVSDSSKECILRTCFTGSIVLDRATAQQLGGCAALFFFLLSPSPPIIDLCVAPLLISMGIRYVLLTFNANKTTLDTFDASGSPKSPG